MLVLLAGFITAGATHCSSCPRVAPAELKMNCHVSLREVTGTEKILTALCYIATPVSSATFRSSDIPMAFDAFQHVTWKFWQFHIMFWGFAFVVLLLSGLSQNRPFDLALVRNLCYLTLGFFSCLAFLPLGERLVRWPNGLSLLALLLFAYTVGSLASFLVNLFWVLALAAADARLSVSFLFSGALNFSLIILVWCGFYFAFKQGLGFKSGDEEAKAAQAIASISSLTSYPDFIALERLGKVSLIPFANISLIKACGDYVEFTCEQETYLKRTTISQIEKLANPLQFQRVHRSAIINLAEIKEMEAKGRGDYTIILSSGESVACSRTYMKALRERVDIVL